MRKRSRCVSLRVAERLLDAAEWKWGNQCAKETVSDTRQRPSRLTPGSSREKGTAVWLPAPLSPPGTAFPGSETEASLGKSH